MANSRTTQKLLQFVGGGNLLRKGSAMIAVIFEVWPAPGRKEDYLAMAAALRADLEAVDGFISVERFQSLTEPGKLLSLSIWRDEDAVRTWRNTVRHRETQKAGRAGVFADYRLRVADVLRDYGMNARAEAPADSRAVHDAPANV
jgi:heme-degrading monooxygenase HmoA